MGARNLLKSLTHLINLNTLKIELQANDIGGASAQELLKPLVNYTNLTYLYVGLWKNGILSNVGPRDILKPLVHLKNLKDPVVWI